MKYIYFILILYTAKITANEDVNSKIDIENLIDYLESRCAESYYHMENSDTDKVQYFFKGKFMAYKDVKDWIEYPNLKHQ